MLGPLFRNNTMGSNWIDLKCSSQYVLTSLPPLTKQTLTEGLVQAKSLLAVFARAMTQANKPLACTKSTKPRPPVLAWYRLTNPLPTGS